MLWHNDNEGGFTLGELAFVKLDSEVNKISKANSFIEASYRLTVTEQKIILCLASNIQKDDTDFKTYLFSTREFINWLGLKGQSAYSELKKITHNLLSKTFTVKIENKLIQVSWLSYVSYNDRDGTMELRFDPFLKPYLLQLKREFTSYRLANVVKLNSFYSIRIYELLKQFERIKERTLEVDKLKELLGAKDIYPRYANFKQRVLLTAQKELNAHTDISFDFEEIKVGKRVQKIRFIIHSKNPLSNFPITEDLPTVRDDDNSFERECQRLLQAWGIQADKKVLERWKEHGKEKVIDLLENLQNRYDIENPIAYVTAVLNRSSESAINTNSDKDFEAKRILQQFIARHENSRELLPEWFIRDEAIEMLTKVFSREEAEAFWDLHKDECMAELEKRIRWNMTRRRR